MKKKVHATALVFFGLAMTFYLLAWIPAAGIFTLFGMLFELAAWISLVGDSPADKEFK